jgi:hypothetical protein
VCVMVQAIMKHQLFLFSFCRLLEHVVNQTYSVIMLDVKIFVNHTSVANSDNVGRRVFVWLLAEATSLNI